MKQEKTMCAYKYYSWKEVLYNAHKPAEMICMSLGEMNMDTMKVLFV